MGARSGATSGPKSSVQAIGTTPDRALVDPITLVGLIFESAAGLRHLLSPRLEREIGVGGQAFDVLIRLERTPGRALRMTDLAAQTGLTKSGLTRAIDRLVAEGLVERAECDRDGRGTYAVLTATGSACVSAVLDRHRDDIVRLLEGAMTETERVALAALLTKIRDRVHPGATARTTEAPIQA